MNTRYLPESELILTKDNQGQQRVYHLQLAPQDIADTIILVGDRNRVGKISRHFDNIEAEIEYREFITHTGTYKGKRLTVIGTGIGGDNIEIVMNEVDAAVNVDFATRTIKASGTVQADLLSGIARVAIILLTGSIAIRYMGLANEIINLAFGLTLGALAIAVAIAFGIGGREVAARKLEEWIGTKKSG